MRNRGKQKLWVYCHQRDQRESGIRVSSGRRQIYIPILSRSHVNLNALNHSLIKCCILGSLGADQPNGLVKVIRPVSHKPNNIPYKDWEWTFSAPILIICYLISYIDRDLVKMYASCYLLLTCLVIILPSCILSLTKWQSISMCLVLS